MKALEERKQAIREHFSYLERLQVALLITDPETDEILYVSRAMNETYKLKNGFVGKTCYEIYGEGPAHRCAFCPKSKLDRAPDETVNWERYHRRSKRWFRHSDTYALWQDGTRIHIQHITDITHEKQAQQSVARQTAQQELLATVTRILSVPQENVYEQIHRAFAEIGTFAALDRVVLLKREPHGRDASVECAWFQSESSRPALLRTDLPLPFDFAANGEGPQQYIFCDSIAKSAVYSGWKQYGVKSFLAVPVHAEGARRILSFECCTRAKPMEKNHAHLSITVADIIANTLIRRRRIAHMQRSRSQAQTLIEAMPVGCLLLDKSMHIVACNRHALARSGFESKEALQAHFFDRTPATRPDGQSSHDFLREKFDEAMKSGRTTFIWSYIDAQGRTFPLRMDMVRVPWEGGYHAAVYTRSIARELGESEKRRTAEKHAQLMLDTTPLICSMWNARFDILDCNAEALRLLGPVSKAEFISNFFRFAPMLQSDGEPSQDKAVRMLSKALESGYECCEWIFLTADGTPLPVESILIRVDWDGEYRILVYSRDLRALKAAHEKERQAELRTQLMLDTLPMASYMISRRHEVVDCNREALRMFQAKGRDHLLHHFLEEFSPPYQADGQPSAAKANELIDAAFRDGSVLFSWTHQLPNGEVIPTEISLVRVNWTQGEELVCAYTRDLRQVKRAEGELRQKTMLLETVNKIAERLLPADPASDREPMSLSMQQLAQSVGVDALRIWRNLHDGTSFQLVRAWPPELERSDGAIHPYAALPYWRKMVFENRTINSPVDALPPEERAIFKEEGVQAVLCIPLAAQNSPWGFISFDNRHSCRPFTRSEEHALRSGSILLASALYRNATTQQLIDANVALKEHQKLLSAVNQVAELILSAEGKDFPLLVQKSLMLIGEGVGASGAALWENFHGEDGALYAHRLPAWRAGRDFAETATAETLRVKDYIPEWDERGRLCDLAFSPEEMNAPLKALSLLQGNEHLLLIPLVLQDDFWGFTALRHLNIGHAFSEEERQIIRSGSLMIAETIMRNHLSENLHEIEALAAADALTGLLNRASFFPQARALFARSRREEAELCVMFLDIDHFKTINDSYGHAFGDTVLVRVADILRSSVRPQDLCARYGGEEFVVILAQSGRAAAEKVAARIMDGIRQTRFDEQPAFSFTTSIGLVSPGPGAEESVELCIEQADAALYHAKRTGRNRLVNFADLP